jgi:two-component system cell cycle sensor histidine kinase/response regulator CckA
MKLFRRFSIRTKMSIIILAVGFPVVAAACFHLCVMYNADYKKTEQAAVATAQSIAYQYNAQVEGIRNLLTALSHFPEVREKNKKACTTIIRNILLQNPSSINIGIADLKGNLIASGIPAHFNIGDRKYFRDALRSKRFSSGEFVVSRAVGKPAINFALPVLDSASKPVAVLYATFDLNQFNRIFDAQKLPTNSILNLTDYKGIVLHHYPNQEKVKPGIFAHTLRVQTMRVYSSITDWTALSGFSLSSACDSILTIRHTYTSMYQLLKKPFWRV